MQNRTTYVLLSDCTSNNGTVEEISTDAEKVLTCWEDDHGSEATYKAVRLTAEEASGLKVGDRIAVDFEAQSVILSDWM